MGACLVVRHRVKGTKHKLMHTQYRVHSTIPRRARMLCWRQAHGPGYMAIYCGFLVRGGFSPLLLQAHQTLSASWLGPIGQPVYISILLVCCFSWHRMRGDLFGRGVH
ncbi:hypothetical protein QBC46DRAFT_95710 [Diplogelasinospora grovesii]|uniref:Uncharacterized protein n=1 Tax=Diplogelasinospora grovesii TaxID=303347 RepID=A0AAN6S9P9_9PEZI|nr:hypothetical protein QBC46DRAFT_95710 [Diplogelasinospora grovesii]